MTSLLARPLLPEPVVRVIYFDAEAKISNRPTATKWQSSDGGSCARECSVSRVE